MFVLRGVGKDGGGGEMVAAGVSMVEMVAVGMEMVEMVVADLLNDTVPSGSDVVLWVEEET
jgi:hypothetical protein